jgi:hypothetical protein
MITTKVIVDTCVRCKQPVLTGYAEGIRARVDLVAINRAGLIAAILAGHPTYRLTRVGLVELDADRINSRTISGPMVTAHRCGQPPPPEYRDIRPAQPAPEQDERIPY